MALLTMSSGAGLASAQQPKVDVPPGTDPVLTSSSKAKAFDYDGDGVTDMAVWRPVEANWYILPSAGGRMLVRKLGKEGDRPVPADYNGDGKTDLAVFRASEGLWLILGEDGVTTTRQFGVSGDRPVPADYDGDSITDLAVFRPGDGTWHIQQSSDPTRGPGLVQQWGVKGDIPVPADYDSDNFANIAVFRQTEGMWYILNSDGSYTAQQWGSEGDKPVPADYDGDRGIDIAVYRAIPQLFRTNEGANWYVLGSNVGSMGAQWGAIADRPVPGDYDGDGKTDFAVFRPDAGKWYVVESSSKLGVTKEVELGQSGDVPVSSGYIVD